MHRSSFKVLAVAPLLALAAAACGSSTSAGSSATSAGSSASGAPIVVGAMGSFTGAGSGSTATAKDVMTAWVDYTNAHGGVNGHPIKVDMIDDANNPSQSLTGVKQLVQQDHVIAIFDLSDDLDSTWASYLVPLGIPVLGDAQSPVYLTNSDYYSTGSTVTAVIYGELYAAKQAGIRKLGAVYCAEISTCALGIPLIRQTGAALGVHLVYSSKISSTAADYTAPCLAAKAAGATGLNATAASTTVVNMAQSCYTQGYKPTWVTGAGEMTNSWLTIPAFDDRAVGMVQDVPWFDDSTPATKTMQAAIKQYAPSVLTNPNFGEVGIVSWATGTVFASIAKTGNLGPSSTPADVVKALDGVSGDTFGGITPPLTFTAGKPSPVPCSYIVSDTSNKWTEPQGLTLACMPAS